jgi:hypothetical protein
MYPERDSLHVSVVSDDKTKLKSSDINTTKPLIPNDKVAPLKATEQRPKSQSNGRVS